MTRVRARTRYRLRNLVFRVVLTLVLLAGIGLGGLVTRSILMRSMADATAAETDLRSGVKVLTAAGLDLTPIEASQATSDFHTAEVIFGRLRDHTNSIWLWPISVLPWAGDQVRAAKDLADIGVRSARAGAIVVGALSHSATVNPGSTSPSEPGHKILQFLDAIDPTQAQLSAELDAAVADRRDIPRSGLVSPLSRAVSQLDNQADLASIREALAALRADEPGIRGLLGSGGPVSYLVLEQDPAELRATGGFIGSVGFLTFDHGRTGSFDPVDILTIDRDAAGNILGFGPYSTHVPVPTPLATAFHLNSLTLRDANWSPDFPTASQQAEGLLQVETGRKVDGVIAIDPFLIGHLLDAVGSVTVPETGDVVNSRNFFETVLNRVEVTPTGPRKSFLTYVAKAIIPKLLTVPRNRWLTLLQDFSWGCNVRSLQAHFHDPKIQGLVDRYRCGGEVGNLHGDGVMVVDSNLGGNKDDYWLQRKFTLSVALKGDGTARHTLHINYSGLSQHDIHLTQYRGYLGWLRVYLPKSTSNIESSGADLRAIGDELGRLVVGGWVFVPFDHSLDVVVSYTVSSAEMRSSEGRTSLLWQKQAGRPADAISISFTPPAGQKIRGIRLGSHFNVTKVVASDLSVDRRFVVEYDRSWEAPIHLCCGVLVPSSGLSRVPERVILPRQ